MTENFTPKQQRFIEEYLIDLNATQAAIRAGYSEKGARTEGARLLANADIAHAIAERRKVITEKCEIDAEWIRKKLVDVVERSLQAEPVMKFNYESKKLEETGEYTFDSRGANRALELLGKDLGMFTDKVDVTVRKPISEMTEAELDAEIAEYERTTGAVLPRATH